MVKGNIKNPVQELTPSRHSVKAGSLPSSLSIERELCISAQGVEKGFREETRLDLSASVVKERTVQREKGARAKACL